MATSKHFSDVELRCPHCHMNNCTPRLVETLELLRILVGKPVVVDSGYRCAIHNASVHGEINSQHLLGNAADIRVAGVSPLELYRIAKTIPTFHGFGVAGEYLHVDVRPGKVSKWCYGANKRPTTWDTALDEGPPPDGPGGSSGQ